MNKDLFLAKPEPESDEEEDEENEEEEEDTGKLKLKTDQELDRYAFYKQATAQHPIPTTQLVQFAFLKSDPTLFATVTRASKFFKTSED